MNSPGNASDRRLRYRARVVTTRPVRARGDDHLTRFAPDCLHDMARQVEDNCVWFNIEHLSFLPPFGRWRSAEIELCEDGEEELFFDGEELPHYVGSFDDDALYERVAHLAVRPAPSVKAEIHYDRRNHDRPTARDIKLESRCPARARERRAELPPLEYVLSIPVVWGAARFAGAFLEELGRAAGEALAGKIRTWAGKSKQPDRSLVFAVKFKLDDHRRLRGFVIAGPSEGDEVLERALDNVEHLATIAGFQAEQDLLPGMIESAFFFDGERWRLGWWTDGERVIQTSWLQQNPPDVVGVLGRPPLEPPL